MAEAVTNDGDVFDVERIDRPLADLRFTDHEELTSWLNVYIEAMGRARKS